jgi:hypothetical protein
MPQHADAAHTGIEYADIILFGVHLLTNYPVFFFILSKKPMGCNKENALPFRRGYFATLLSKVVPLPGIFH